MRLRKDESYVNICSNQSTSLALGYQICKFTVTVFIFSFNVILRSWTEYLNKISMVITFGSVLYKDRISSRDRAPEAEVRSSSVVCFGFMTRMRWDCVESPSVSVPCPATVAVRASVPLSSREYSSHPVCGTPHPSPSQTTCCKHTTHQLTNNPNYFEQSTEKIKFNPLQIECTAPSSMN